MVGSETPPNSATTAVDANQGSKIFADEDDNIDSLARAETQPDEEEDKADSGSNDQFNKENGIRPLQPVKPATYVKEFWKFRMRAADDDEHQ